MNFSGSTEFFRSAQYAWTSGMVGGVNRAAVTLFSSFFFSCSDLF